MAKLLFSHDDQCVLTYAELNIIMFHLVEHLQRLQRLVSEGEAELGQSVVFTVHTDLHPAVNQSEVSIIKYQNQVLCINQSEIDNICVNQSRISTMYLCQPIR